MKVKIFRGIPGSGKSTQARKVANEVSAAGGRAPIFSADFFFAKSGTYQFDRSKLGEAHADCLRKFTLALLDCWEWPQDNTVLVVDNTNTTAEEIAPYAQLALAFGADLEVVTVVASQEEAFARQVHGVPAKNHKQMYERLTRTKLPPQWPQRTLHIAPDRAEQK